MQTPHGQPIDGGSISSAMLDAVFPAPPGSTLHLPNSPTSVTNRGMRQDRLVLPSLVNCPTFDGGEIPAFLYLPQNRQSEELPIVIYVHGGPESQSRPIFNPVIQYFVAHGFGVLAPNVRGSTGYGYQYQSLDDVRLRMDSVADLQQAVFWLCQSGIADPEQIAVMGGSYGGIMVVSAITIYPDLL